MMTARADASVTILVIGTADTKADELLLLKAEIEAAGAAALIMDVGVLGAPRFAPDIDHRAVAAAAGYSLEAVAALGDENRAMQAMAIGATAIALDLVARGRIAGVLALGGTMGTDLALEVTKALPLGVAKLIVSSVAFSHIIAPERIAPDLMMVLWAGGLWGLNTACVSVLRQAAAAAVGAARVGRGPVSWSKPAIGVSSLGSACCRYLGVLKPALEARGYEVVVFHAVGLGGRALETLAEQGALAAVLDLTLIEVSNHALGSVVSAGPDRLEAAGRAGVPQIVAPGAIDCLDLRPWLPLPEALHGRPFHAHNRLVGAVATSPADKRLVAETIAAKLNRATGPTAFVMPLGGVDEWDRPGNPLHDPEGIAGFAETIAASLSPTVHHVAVDAHLNDPGFTDAVIALFDAWVAAGLIPAGRRSAAA